MSVFFSSEPPPSDPQLAELWYLLTNEYFADALQLAGQVCQDNSAPIEYFCGLALAYGENGYYAEAEQVARTAISFGELHWRARHALAVALMHQGRFLGALDAFGFHRFPIELYVVRAQIEKMGGFDDSLRVTLEDALEVENTPPAIQLYLGYLYGSMADEDPHWPGREGWAQVKRLGDQIDVWQRDATRHARTPYGEILTQQIAAIQRVLRR